MPKYFESGNSRGEYMEGFFNEISAISIKRIQEETMKQVTNNDNLYLDVYINDEPDLRLIPPSLMQAWAKTIAEQLLKGDEQ